MESVIKRLLARWHGRHLH